MRISKAMGRKTILVAATILSVLLGVTFRNAAAAESGCVTCHIDKEMLQKTVKAETGQKSAMQSGAG